MKKIRILLAVAVLVVAGCRAQEGAPRVAAQPGLPPQAIADVVVVELNSLNNIIAPLGNDVDQSGTGLAITAVTVDQVIPATGGSVVSTDGASVNFTPPPNFIGVVTLEYVIADGTGAVSSAAIAISVLPVALPPVALPDAVTVTQDSGATDIDVLANDVDFAGGGLTLTGISVATSLPAATHTLALVANQVRFTPAAGFVGAVIVNYAATDTNGASADGVLSIVVSPLDLPVGPVPVPDAAVVAQDSGATDIDVLANDVDPVGGGLTLTGAVVATSLPAGAHTVAISGNQVRFTPAAGFAGAVVVSYTVTDTGGNSADGVLTVVVSPLDLSIGPVPLPDAAVVTQDSGATDIGVVANDVDLAGGGLTLTGVSVTASQPTAVHTVAIAGNQVRFTPAAGFAGAVVISYTVTDINGNSADGVLSVVVSPLALPVGPLAIPDAAVVAQDSVANGIDVLANDIDFAGGGLTLTGATVTNSLPTGLHTVAIAGNQVQFTPEAGFAGIVVVTYTVQDVNGVSYNGLLNIEVTPAALPLLPLALPEVDTASSSAGAQLFDVLANDLDPAGGGLTLTNVSMTGLPALNAGSVAIVGNQVQYTPVLGYIGVVTVTYTAQDINGNTTDGQLSLTVAP
jgi:hypothetical protein